MSNQIDFRGQLRRQGHQEHSPALPPVVATEILLILPGLVPAVTMTKAFPFFLSEAIASPCVLTKERGKYFSLVHPFPIQFILPMKLRYLT